MRQNANQTKAMTEVALALSMGFFSIMVLAMVSMGSVSIENGATIKTDSAVSIEPSFNESPSHNKAHIGHTVVSNQNLLIWFKEDFFDHKLNKVDGKILVDQMNEPVLAVSPNLNLKGLIRLQNILQNKRLRITNLDRTWLSRLEKFKK